MELRASARLRVSLWMEAQEGAKGCGDLLLPCRLLHPCALGAKWQGAISCWSTGGGVERGSGSPLCRAWALGFLGGKPENPT